MKTGLFLAIGAGCGYMALHRSRRPARIPLQGKIVLITGGSRGLGLALAREFGARGAIVAICARDLAELHRAHADLVARGITARIFPCDITQRDQVRSMVEQLGPVDILVNNAGIIQVGPFENLDHQDFEQAMDVIFWGTLNTTIAVLPSMRRQGDGSIVNITSIGGKVSVPHLLPYSCAKFAAVGLSEGLRTELAPHGIRVTTIIPGLLRTGSHLNVQFKGRHRGEYAWFAAGAATPFISIEAARAARSIVEATVQRESQKILSIPADFLARLHGLLPGLTAKILAIANHFLPQAEDGSSVPRTGIGIEREFNSSLWKMATQPGRKAAGSLNEI